jgi:integral membrane protein (TIGR01906 family)
MKQQAARGQGMTERVATAALIVALPFFLLLNNLYLFVSPVFLRHEYGEKSLPPVLSFDAEERLTIAQTTVVYLRSGADVDLLETLGVFNDRELAHLADVKRVMKGAFIIHTTSALTVAAALVLLCLRAETRKRVPFYVFLACVVLAAMLLMTAFVVYFNFDWFFITFHHLFFEGDSWLFPTTDTLIQLFPPQFWIDAALKYALLTLAEAVLMGGMARGLILVLGDRREERIES